MGKVTSHINSSEMLSSIDLINQSRGVNADIASLSSQLADRATVIKPTMSQTDIQNAINNSVTKTVKFMAGTYNITGITLTNVDVYGEGSNNTILNCAITFGSNVNIKGIKFGISGTPSTCLNGASNVWISNCFIFGSGFAVNDKSINNIHFLNCEIANCETEGINLVDKSTLAKHIQDIYLENCYFHDNGYMNFQCISRQDGTNDVVSGYANIQLLKCVFEKPVVSPNASNINVSFDSYELANKNPSGTVIVRNCKFINGYYVFENAGATDLIFENNILIQNTSSDRVLSMSRLDNKYSNAIIKNNKFSGNGSVYVNGNDNVFENNVLDMVNGGIVLNSGDNIKCRYNNVKAQWNPISISNSLKVLLYSNFLSNTVNSNANSIIISNCNGSVVSLINNIIDTNAIPIQITTSTSEIIDSGNRNSKGNNMPSYYTGNGNNGSIKSVQKYTSAKSFSVTNNSLTNQSPMILKCTWASRNNNAPAGDRFSASFATFSSTSALPALDKTGNVTVAVDTTSGKAVFTFTIVPTTNDSVLFDIEMITLKANDWTIN